MRGDRPHRSSQSHCVCCVCGCSCVADRRLELRRGWGPDDDASESTRRGAVDPTNRPSEEAHRSPSHAHHHHLPPRNEPTHARRNTRITRGTSRPLRARAATGASACVRAATTADWKRGATPICGRVRGLRLSVSPTDSSRTRTLLPCLVSPVPFRARRLVRALRPARPPRHLASLASSSSAPLTRLLPPSLPVCAPVSVAFRVGSPVARALWASSLVAPRSDGRACSESRFGWW